MRPFAIALISTLLIAPTAPSNTATYLEKPFGKIHPLISPNGKHALWGDYDHSELHLEDTANQIDRTVNGITVQTATLAWSPDSSYFAVNDRVGSNLEEAYLFNTITLHRTDLHDMLNSGSPQANVYFTKLPHSRSVLHSYLHVIRWLDDQHFELQLHGDTDGHFANDNINAHLYPAECFDLHYRVSIGGGVQQISQRVRPASATEPACTGQ